MPLKVSSPARVCLFGEHQDYLGLEVISAAINVRIYVTISPNGTGFMRYSLPDMGERYEFSIDDLTYSKKRDYLKSAVKVVKEATGKMEGFDIEIRSEIPIAKGVSSSSAMLVALVKALLEALNSPLAKDPKEVARLAHRAEVVEFNEPGGMMDQVTSALGGVLHINFERGFEVEELELSVDGSFVLADSGKPKDTTGILAATKEPVLEGLKILKGMGYPGTIRGLARLENWKEVVSKIPDKSIRRKVRANVEDFFILKEALRGIKEGISPERFGRLLYEHHKRLRDDLEVSTPEIDEIIETAMRVGAYGGKLTGSGGGGCVVLFAPKDTVPRVIEAIKERGYDAKEIRIDEGVRVEEKW